MTMMRKGHKTIIKPSASVELVEEQRLILDMYHLLFDAYRRDFGIASAPWHSKTGVPPDEKIINTYFRIRPKGVGNLLPSYEGWYFSPEYSYPIPINRAVVTQQNESIGFYPGRKYWAIVNDIDNKAETDQLRVLEEKILMRAEYHLLFHKSTAILSRGIAQAKLDLELADEDFRYASTHFDRLSACYPPDEVAVARSQLEQAYCRSTLYRVRLHWLSIWQVYNEKHLRSMPDKARSSVTPGNFSGLIKPRELDEAWALLEPIFRRYKVRMAENINRHPEIIVRHPETVKYESISPFDLLGAWYSSMLFRCGATWQDLIRIRRNNPDETGERGHRTWATIVKRKVKRTLYG